MKGELPLEHLRHFVSLDVRRQGQELHLERYEVMAPMPTRGGKSKAGRGQAARRGQPVRRSQVSQRGTRAGS